MLLLVAVQYQNNINLRRDFQSHQSWCVFNLFQRVSPKRGVSREIWRNRPVRVTFLEDCRADGQGKWPHNPLTTFCEQRGEVGRIPEIVPKFTAQRKSL